MSLYQIADTYKALLEQIEAGEIPEEAIADTLEGLEGEFTDKADNIACYIKSLTAESKAIQEEAKVLNERAKAKANKADRLTEYLLQTMQGLGKSKVETTRNMITVKTNPPAVNVFDPELLAQLHPDLLTYKTPEPNKTAIKALLKDGVEIKGCELVQKQSLGIK